MKNQHLKLKCKFSIFALAAVALQLSCAHNQPALHDADLSILSGEIYFKNLRQLTFGGSNTFARWSSDGNWLTFQHTGPGITVVTPKACSQSYIMHLDGSELKRISNGKGQTSESVFSSDGSRIFYSSTAAIEPDCSNASTHPMNPMIPMGPMIPKLDSYQLYSASIDQSKDFFPLEPGAPKSYHAEINGCRDGSVIFTSGRKGNLDLYLAKIDRLGTLTQIQQITSEKSYQGRASFSTDCKEIIWHASVGKKFEIWTSHADGSESRQVTHLNALSFAATFFPEGDRILFSSNFKNPKKRNFNLFSIKLDGTDLQQITFSNSFDGFAMFAPNMKYLVFSSTRNSTANQETNLFMAEWQSPEASKTVKTPVE